MAAACNDMLLATLEFLETKEIEEIYLMGYYEGGYATLSTQQLIESQNNISLKAVYSSVPELQAIIGDAFPKFVVSVGDEVSLPHKWTGPKNSTLASNEQRKTVLSSINSKIGHYKTTKF